MIFNLTLPPAVILTWMQMRALAWDGWVTPAFSIQDLETITGKSHQTLSKHLSMLRKMNLLQWRSISQRKIIISFSKEQSTEPEIKPTYCRAAATTILNTSSLEHADPPSYFPSSILGYLSYQEGQD
jgi:alpha-amylase/alpha-mannosidase (GH57 family)